MYSLTLSGRPTRSEPFIANITHLARGWQRSKQAVGGFWVGSFHIDGAQLVRNRLTDFYNNNLGFIVREYTAGGLLSWEGYIAEMRLILDGVEHMRSLTPENWHNKANIYYTYPASEDSEQGALAYDVSAPNDSFQDQGQDFSDWQTTAGDSLYRIKVTNSDSTVGWAFLGATFTTTNTNDSIYCFEDVERTEEGWCGTHQGKTPSSYIIERVDLAGVRTSTGWAENTDASDEYGEMQYIETLGSVPGEVATFLRARLQAQYAWPRSRMVGGIIPDSSGSEDRLLVAVAGFWHTLNWRYYTTSRLAACDDLINTLVAASEFVTAGRIETNEMAAKADCDPIPQRLGDLIENIVNLGDESGNLWKGGVYHSKKLVYEPAPTIVDYTLRGGRLFIKGGAAVNPAQLKPGFLLRVSDIMLAGQPPGTSSVWDDPQVAYVDQVTFIAPDTLQLKLYGEEESVVLLQRQIREGS